MTDDTDDDDFVEVVTDRDGQDWLIALSKEDIELMRNRFNVPKRLLKTLNDATEDLRLTRDCGTRHLHFIVYSNGAFGLAVAPLFDIARYVRAHFKTG
jgi:hypothetical protein